MNFAFIVSAFSFFLVNMAHAVIGGIPNRLKDVSTLELKISHRMWSGRDGRYVSVPGTCSSVIVGTHPLTLLTASHCFRDPDLDEKNGLPKVEILESSLQSKLTLSKAIYSPIKHVLHNGIADIAVLVFDGAIDSSWFAVPIARHPIVSNEVFICGFGYSESEGYSNLPRCATRNTTANLLDFSQFVPSKYKSLDAGLFAVLETQFNSKSSRFSSMEKIIGVNRLKQNGYSLEVPMPREGDSGGPWFVRENGSGKLRLLALTSFIETFYRKNNVWPVFKDHNSPTQDLPYAAYGIRLDNQEAQAILDSARKHGADISTE